MEIRTATHCDPVLHDLCYAVKSKQECMGETRALIGGGGGEGGEYSYLLVLPDEFLLKSAVIKVNFKRRRTTAGDSS